MSKQPLTISESAAVQMPMHGYKSDSYEAESKY